MLDLMFKAAHAVVLVGWLALFLAPVRPSVLISTARATSVLLAAVYTILFAVSAPAASVLVTNYTLDGIGVFFADPSLRLLGWIHYLAFDLWVGTWEADEARRVGLPHGILLVSLVLTFLVGPVGLLSFILFRALRRETPAKSGPV